MFEKFILVFILISILGSIFDFYFGVSFSLFLIYVFSNYVLFFCDVFQQNIEKKIYKDEFEKDQHDYVKRSYYDVMSSNLKRAGLDLTKFGPAVQDLVWSTAVQYGPGRIDLFTTPLQGKSELNDREIINIVSEYKIAQAPSNFKSSGTEIAKAQQVRYTSEKTSLLKLVTV
jgi:hypothetical protein